MNILGQVAVYPKPDERIKRLTELAYNLWWSWHPEAWTLYAEIDRTLWEQVNHNPVAFLRQVSQQALDRAAGDPAYMAHYAAVMQAFDGYLHPDTTWYDTTFRDPERQLIAYFSAEFGLHESLPIYSGGLGILAGDHCKAASDLGLPFVGVGFLYPQGYFQQRIDADGHQQAIYEKLNFADVPATPALDADGDEIMVVRRPARPHHLRQGLAHPGRARAGLPDGHGRRAQRPGRSRAVGPPVRRQPGDADLAGGSAGHRRRAGAARAGPAADRLAHERGPCGLPATRAYPRVCAGEGPGLPTLRCGPPARMRSSPPIRPCRPGNDAFPLGPDGSLLLATSGRQMGLDRDRFWTSAATTIRGGRSSA